MGLLSLIFPIAYLGILVGSLATFSHLYRQRKLNAKLRLAPYFPPHTPRNIYLSLMHLPDTDPSNNTTVKVPDSVLRAALLNRAVEDVIRIMELRTRKGALNQLLQRGTVGDEIWQRLLRAEQELEMEVKDVVGEANALSPGWGAAIFQSASEMAQNRIMKEKLAAIRATTEKEKAEWEATREMARKELEGDDEEDDDNDDRELKGKGVKGTNVVKSTVGGSVDGQEKVKAAKNVSSDDDTVLVETPGDMTSTPGGGSGARNRKKKGKK